MESTPDLNHDMLMLQFTEGVKQERYTVIGHRINERFQINILEAIPLMPLLIIHFHFPHSEPVSIQPEVSDCCHANAAAAFTQPIRE